MTMRAKKLMFSAPTLLLVPVCLLVSVFIGSVTTPTAHAAQSIPYKVNFQGRLTDSSGNIKTDGLYNMRIRIYDSATNGNVLWTADRSYGGSGNADHRVQVTNGLFSVQLGDTSAGVGDPVLPPTLFNSQTYAGLYLEVELASTATATCSTAAGCASWTEGAMTPRSQLGAAPYAFNSDTLDGVDGSSYARNDAVNTFSQANTFNKTISIQGGNGTGLEVSTNSYINFNQSWNGTGYNVQDTGGSAQILNGPFTGLVINVSAGKTSGTPAYNVPALVVQALTDNVRGTVDNGLTYGTNLISNPGFEFGCTGWDNTGTCTGDTANARSGVQAGKYVQSTATSSNSSNSRFVSVQQGDILYGQAYIKSSVTTNGSGGVGINFFDKNGLYVSTGGTSTIANPGTNYVLKTTTATVPANASYATFFTSYYGDGSTGGTWYIDDASMYISNNVAPTLYKNSVNTTAAFQIQDASGTALFMADTTNNALLVGGGDVAPASNITLLVLDNKNSAGDPTGRAGAMYYNTTLGKFRCFTTTWKNCDDGLAYANTSIPSGNTVANTTTETNFASAYNMPANDCQPGKVYKIRAQGTYGTTTTAPALTMRVKIGTTVIGLPTNTTTTASMSGRLWFIDFYITCDTSGTSGTVEGQGDIKRYTSNVALTTYEMVNTATKTIDTTVAQTMQISAQWGTANAANTITLRQLVVTAMGP